MQTINKFLVLSISFGFLASCVSTSQRDPASSNDQTTLSGLRVNPVRYTLAPKWKVILHDGEKTSWEPTKLNLTTYQLGSPQGFQDFQARVEDLRSRNDAAARADKKGKGFLDKGSLLALNEISALLKLIQANQLQGKDLNDAYEHVAEMASSFSYAYQYPIPQKLFVLAAPFKILSQFYNPPSIGEPAVTSVDLLSYDQPDLSKVDPVDSSFWKNSGSVSSKNLYVGFNRSDVPHFDKPCKYLEPKTSYGIHPGFNISCDGVKWKMKFGNETHTEAFTTRLVWALGFNAIPVDYTPTFTLDYDRKILTEFNSRHSLSTTITGIGFDIKKFEMQKYFDPFEVGVSGAILKDGSRIDAKTLRARLIKVSTPKAETDANNYNTNFESTIQYLTFNEASAQTSAKENEKKVGPWNWNDLDHPNRRAFRAFGMLAAFLNFFDARTDNNTIEFVYDADGSKSIKHFVSDLGSGLGAGSNLLNQLNGVPNKYPWEILRAVEAEESSPSPLDAASVSQDRNKKYGKNVRFIDHFDFLDYHVIQDNLAFDRMQVDDARWMVRRLAQFTEAQFQDALIAAGWSAAEVKVYLEKFASRRDNMIRALALENEIPLMRPNGADRNINFDPTTERAVTVSLNPQIAAPYNNKKLIKGLIVQQ